MLQVSIETGIAEEYLTAELSVLPAVREKKCPAVGKWKVWQEGAEKNHMDDRRSGCGGNYFDQWNFQRSIFAHN